MVLFHKGLTMIRVLFILGLFTDVTMSTPFPIEKPLVGFATGTMTSILLEKLLHVEKEDKPKCALSIGNKMTESRLINPFLYIEHGENAMPVPIKVDNNDTTVESLFEAAHEGGDTSGLLFYEIENVKTYLMIFWKITGPKTTATYTANRFHIEFVPAVKFLTDEASLRQTYIDNKAFSSKMKEASEHIVVTESLWIPSKVPGRKIDKFQATVRAQMTMSKQAEFLVEIMDDLTPPAPQYFYKRSGIEVAVGLGITKVLLNLAFKKATKYIPSEQTGTISIENVSEDKTLVEPSWYISSGLTTSIVPWEIKPSKTGEITYSVPRFGASIKESFKHTVFFTSYQIQGLDYYVVMGTWFPLKLQPGGKGIFHREESLFTLFVMEKPDNPLHTMKLTVQRLGELLGQAGGNIAKLNEMLQTSANYKYIYDAIPNTNTAAKLKVVGVKATKFETYREWQYPIFGPKGPRIGTAREEFHVKIVAAVGVGKSSGLAVRVEVVKGASENAQSFLQNNPQIYKEPPKDESSTQAAGNSVSGAPDTGSSRISALGGGSSTAGTRPMWAAQDAMRLKTGAGSNLGYDVPGTMEPGTGGDGSVFGHGPFGAGIRKRRIKSKKSPN